MSDKDHNDNVAYILWTELQYRDKYVLHHKYDEPYIDGSYDVDILCMSDSHPVYKRYDVLLTINTDDL
jgi:hypothetical protein